MMKRILSVLIPAISLSAAAGAQSALSTQGFGYPAGGIGVGALSSGGATAEVDAISVLNPATLINFGRAGLAAQMAPEVRRLSGPEGTASTTTMRFPLYAAGVTLSERLRMGISASTFLDRTWSSRLEATQIVNGEEIESTTLWSSKGSINDVRVALAYRIASSLSVGAGIHFFTGSNDIRVATDYEAADILDIDLSSRLGYSGRAFSAGLLWKPLSTLNVGASARAGGPLNLRRAGVNESSAEVPDRVGVSAVYSGLPGATLAARYEQVSFSQMNGLGTEASSGKDTEDMGAGLEIGGPGLFRGESILRFGLRRRDLPFRAGGLEVTENAYSAGVGLSLANRGAMIDFGVIRVTRDNNSVFRESGWIIATGILVRP
jgi:long-subunit fatty acid transport protein